MKARLVLLGLFIIVVFAGIPQFNVFGSKAQVQTCGAVKPAVFQALTTEKEVPVVISLQPPEGLPAAISVSDMQINTAERQASVLADLAEADLSVTSQYYVVPAIAGLVTLSGANMLACQPDVLSVDLSLQLSAGLGHSVPLIHAPEVHQQGVNGTGVDIAVLDSGIDTDHDDLADNIIGQECFTYVPPFADPCPTPPNVAEDGFGHGTFVSGIITSNGTVAPLLGVERPGVAPNANIFAFKVISDSGAVAPQKVLAALDDIVHNHPPGRFDFINISIQDHVSHQPQECGTDPDDVMPALAVTIGQLRQGGTLTFAISGNDGFKSGVSWPGCIPDVVSVGAVYDNDLGPQSWANYLGQLLCTDPTTAAEQVPCFSSSSEALDLLAPGSEILSTWPFDPYVEFGDGTSAAAASRRRGPELGPAGR